MAWRERVDPRVKQRDPASGTEIGPGDRIGGRDDSDRRSRHAASLRAAGLIGLLLAAFVLLTFGPGALSERRRAAAAEEAIYRRWIARMSCVLSLAAVAAAANLGLSLLRNWGRLAATTLCLLPPAVLLSDGLLLAAVGRRGPLGGLGPGELASLSALAVVCCPLPLYFLWSPLGRAVFSGDRGKAVADQARSDPGFIGVLDGLAFALAELGSCFVMTFAVLSLLADLGVIRSV